MNKKLSLIIFFTIVALTFSSLALAVEEIPVIGKATIKKGTVLPVIMVTMMGGRTVGIVKAFKGHELYILKKLPAKAGVHRGSYMLDGEGFAHDCPTHGEEVIGPSIILLPIELVETGEVTIELF